jgi:hypothetical protein
MVGATARRYITIQRSRYLPNELARRNESQVNNEIKESAWITSYNCQTLKEIMASKGYTHILTTSNHSIVKVVNILLPKE